MSADPRPLTPELLDTFGQALRQVGAPVVESWRPGASAEEIDGLEAGCQGKLSAEARLWWSWHDGVAHQPGRYPDFMIGSAWTPLSAQGSASWRDVIRNGERFSQPNVKWNPGWAVLCASDNSTIAIACDEAPQPLSPILYYDPGVNDHPECPLLPSIGELVHLWIDAIDEGIWRTTETGYDTEDPPSVYERWQAEGRRAELASLL